MANQLDLAMMARAITLSEKGFPAPNPHVGCVIVHDGVVVGEGYHDHAGGIHAEIMALNQADLHAQGATVYVTLEPCSHEGRTGPCSLALIKAGVARVVIAVADPNPIASGGGQQLHEAGIEVEFGVLEQEARAKNRQFLHSVTSGRPWVRAKSAITVDGKIAWPNGSSKWITGPTAREDGHFLRAETGCVLVGRRTVEFDDPRLTARIDGVVNQPVRVVIDPQGKLNGCEAIFSEGGETIWMTSNQEREVLDQQIGLDSLEPIDILRELTSRNVTGVLIEGGAGTLRRFFDADLVDELILYIAPKIYGDGLYWMGSGQAWLPDGVRLTLINSMVLDGDIKLQYIIDK